MAIVEQELQKISHKKSSNTSGFRFNIGHRFHTSTRLYIEEGVNHGDFYDLKSESMSIGRKSECDIYLEDIRVSRSHATIVYLGNGNYALQDDNSANGTKLNGKFLKPYQPQKLKNGDRIQICDTKLMYMKR